MPLAAGHRLLAWCVLAAAPGALVGRALHVQATGKALTAAVAFGMIDFAFLALLLAALYLRRREARPWRLGGTGVHHALGHPDDLGVPPVRPLAA